MAILYDKRQKMSFQLQPVAPIIDGPHNAYDVAFRERDQILFERQYTTYAGSPDGHWYVWHLFRALQLAEALADTETPFNITGDQDKGFNESSTLSVSCGWLHVVLSSNVVVHRHNLPEPVEERRSGLFLYLLTGPQEMGLDSGDYRRFGLACRPADVVAFGQQLGAECREALRQRRELGTLAPADDYIDDDD